ncbi:hypothetical protein D8I24_6514 [Cupriavidus necator H850]|uniref:hypothetical protein n=1 Tax=Cupriavidus necator TaxID=106590 RepID=UPI00129DB84B|nr:hypothetical protein [Cupriavidus necator]KAI3597698.1 hypothetical protein D8I24_6514 [Cupriavidus necator H850]
MTPTKLEAKLQGQSAIARKVYAAVPMQSAWNVADIVGAMRRATRTSVDHRTVIGCLIALKSAGIVSESQAGMFKRVEVKEMAIENPKREVVDSAPVGMPAPPLDPRPIDVIAKIASGLVSVSAQIRELATELEDAWLLIEDGIAAQDANLDKLKQLQSILKSLT